MNSLVVVESPAKSKTLGRYLNNAQGSGNYQILATGGHIYESTKVDIDDGFQLQYNLISSKRNAVESITSAMRSADQLYLATDPDREGEAISAHVYDYLNKNNVLQDKQVHRIVFHEITRQAVLDAIASPGEIKDDLVQAQKSRDALDMLVGFELSPLLIRKLSTPHLSAGRVQSPALRLIVERQREIEQFKPVEYWTITAELKKSGTHDAAAVKPVLAQLTHAAGKKLKERAINDEGRAEAIVDLINEALTETNRQLTVKAIKRKEKRRRPPAPFKTSTLVQSGSSRLRMSASAVTRIAQKLYEGLEINGSLTGLITYTRTDSITLSNQATSQVREYISGRFGSHTLPKSARTYKTKSKTAQEAHEAIRPTDIRLTPEQVKSSLSNEQFAIYDLIWKRTVASQMNDAIYDSVAVEFGVADYQFRATGNTLRDAGWQAIYEGKKDTDDESEDSHSLPEFTEGERVPVEQLKKEQHFTKPPARYNAGSLIKQLEDYGIGRPSTWPTIITKLVDRNYVTVQNQTFFAQALGCAVVDYLNEHFEQYVDYAFTGKLEDKLDDIAQGELERLAVLNEFWKEFSAQLKSKEEAPRFERLLGIDSDSKREILVRVRNGGFFLQKGRRTDEEKPLFQSLSNVTDPKTISFEEAIQLFGDMKLPRKLHEKTQDGRAVEIKTGRYGPYLTLTDEDGNRENLSLNDDQDPISMTIDDVESLLKQPKLPRSLGGKDEFQEVIASRSRYGPYLSVIRADGSKFNVNLGPEDSPFSVELERALEIIKTAKNKRGSRSSKKTVLKAFDNTKIQVLDGRYGPYVTDGEINASLPQGMSATDVDQKTCQELLEKRRQESPKTSNRKSGGRSLKKNAIKTFENGGKQIHVLDGRFGPYVTDGEINASLPRGMSATDVDQKTCQELLEKRRQEGAKPRRQFKQRN